MRRQGTLENEGKDGGAERGFDLLSGAVSTLAWATCGLSRPT